VIELVRQLPPERKREILLALAARSQSSREERYAYAEQQLRRLAAKRGLQWDAMCEEDRETLVDDLIHEDRSCQP
jgi:hypothetical protein